MYRGRFAPSPTGLLHAGSLLAALASWLDARAHHGVWLVRIEDVDTPRCVAEADQTILQQLAACGLVSDEPVLWQSQRSSAYQQALAQLQAAELVYPCYCSRKAIAQAMEQRGYERHRHGELVYPGTCRPGLQTSVQGPHRIPAWRLHTERIAQATGTPAVHWQDRRLGPQQQDVAQAVGDFVLQRADGLWAYQLAVVVDDAAQGITHVVRGQDLADNTARQIVLQQALGLPTPSYLHTPLELGANGEKLSKQNGAEALQLDSPEAVQAALNRAALALGLTPREGTNAEMLAAWVKEWRAVWSPLLLQT
ncbi:tRNA glutamyl-Q(34) synthetase GluQRS [Curvibacter sp. CHRR-16]|uniref:tRNA glutamyl-Q(34) synthetase GluQRS n=1 Tax=Curvibacter sp. CHRR-16 TaxID=2835872 RepID=UPI001BD9C72F|nr:tRNA glutamyl-Q(34) synthetase GluQRS [Curvibacter sp. CHRR-16]